MLKLFEDVDFFDNWHTFKDVIGAAITHDIITFASSTFVFKDID